jgi:hypothetical protein
LLEQAEIADPVSSKNVTYVYKVAVFFEHKEQEVEVAKLNLPDDELTVFTNQSKREIVEIIDSKFRIPEEEAEIQFVGFILLLNKNID